MSDTERKKKDKTMLIVAINVIVMVLYTLFIRITGGAGEEIIGLAFILAAHIILCLLISPFIYSRAFLLSALAVLLVGFSTCYAAYTIH